ncbi:acetyl-CoA C-acetyltransferase, partial [Herbaspirillum sp. B65]|uniref:acetyl-CoA C-acetyltransferase n=1 Tax=Herbaspirillum sp. B65 TaxID=137708 RepID=UPI002090650A
MRRAAIVSPMRTAIGAFGGSLQKVATEDLGAAVIKAVLGKTGLDPELIEDVVFAQSFSNGETPCTGRYLALNAGLPLQSGGMQLDRRCGSGLQAVISAAMMVQTGAADVVLAGGIESMSNVEYYTTSMRWGSKAGSVKFHDRLERGRERAQPEHRFGFISGMPETAETLAREYGISREESDVYALRSHQRAAAAWESGKFTEEVVPVIIPQRKGDPIVFDRDEGIRGNTTLEALSQLRPLIKGGTVTPGNCCQQNDAAAACLIVAEDKLEELGLEPMAYLHSWAVAGCDPARMGIGPVPAIDKLLRRTGLSLTDMGLVEINEAFACQVLAVLKGWTGMIRTSSTSTVPAFHSAIRGGPPGVRIMTSLLQKMSRRQVRYGLETCASAAG